MQVNQLPLPSAILGVRLYTRPYPTTYVQVRTHKKRRINKKWKKRYGFKTARGKYDPHEVIQIGAHFHAYPEGLESIKQEIARCNTEMRTSTSGKQTRPTFIDPTEPMTAERVQKCMDELLSSGILPPEPPGAFELPPMRKVDRWASDSYRLGDADWTKLKTWSQKYLPKEST